MLKKILYISIALISMVAFQATYAHTYTVKMSSDSSPLSFRVNNSNWVQVKPGKTVEKHYKQIENISIKFGGFNNAIRTDCHALIPSWGSPDTAKLSPNSKTGIKVHDGLYTVQGTFPVNDHNVIFHLSSAGVYYCPNFAGDCVVYNCQYAY